MPLGISDTWVDGHEAYVLVECGDPVEVAEAFGTPLRWWPTEGTPQPDGWWLARAAEDRDGHERLRKTIRAFVSREPDLDWVGVHAGASNGDPWAEDDDYIRPMYENAIAALQCAVPPGPELYEAPVRVAARLSRELDSRAMAIWGSDEEWAWEGACLLERSNYLWTASCYSLDEVEKAFAYHQGESDDAGGLDESEGRYESFFLIRPGQAVEKVEQPIRDWTDERMRELGAGIDLGFSLHGAYPDDFLKYGDHVAEFVIAVEP